MKKTNRFGLLAALKGEVLPEQIEQTQEQSPELETSSIHPSCRNSTTSQERES